MPVEMLKRTEAARAALQRDPSAAYDELSPVVLGPHPSAEREAYLHPLLCALSGLQAPSQEGNLPTTRTFLEAEPRWASLLAAIARDATIHVDFRVRALALLSRIQAPEPREMVLDFAGHDDADDLAEIVLAYKDPALVEALIAKTPKRALANLEMFLGLPKRKPTRPTPKKSPPKPITTKKPTPKRR